MHHAAIRVSLLFALLMFAGCVGVSAKVGYARMEVGGDLALDTGGGGGSSAIEQDVGSAFGLGGGQGSPFLRAQADLGGPVVTSSLVWIRESGTGQLNDAFGGLAASTEVSGRLDVALAKISAAYDFDLGLIKVAPGVLFDVFAIDFSARELTLGSREEIDDIVFVPMPFLRAEGGLGPVTAVAEAAYLDIDDLGDNGGRFLDLEAMIEWYPLPLGHFFFGYRFIDIDGNGDTGSESFAADLQIRGWFLGGGLRF